MKSGSAFIGGIVFYAVGGLFFLIKKTLIAVDNFVAALFCLIFLWLSKKYRISAFAAFLAGMSFLPHIIGTWGAYEWASLDYHYDMIVHVVSAFFATFAMMHFMEKIPVKAKGLIALSITIMLGAIIEMSEYWSFLLFGFGSGYLGFGPGDNSQNFGPWENSSIDTTLNFAGALLALCIFYLHNIFKGRRK